MPSENLFRDLPTSTTAELFETLLAGSSFRLERIVSTGHITPPGQWYDQDLDEWVVLLTGAARLRFENEADDRALQPGECLQIPAPMRGIAWSGRASKSRPSGWRSTTERSDSTIIRDDRIVR